MIFELWERERESVLFSVCLQKEFPSNIHCQRFPLHHGVSTSSAVIYNRINDIAMKRSHMTNGSLRLRTASSVCLIYVLTKLPPILFRYLTTMAEARLSRVAHTSGRRVFLSYATFTAQKPSYVHGTLVRLPAVIDQQAVSSLQDEKTPKGLTLINY